MNVRAAPRGTAQREGHTHEGLAASKAGIRVCEARALSAMMRTSPARGARRAQCNGRLLAQNQAACAARAHLCARVVRLAVVRVVCDKAGQQDEAARRHAAAVDLRRTWPDGPPARGRWRQPCGQQRRASSGEDPSARSGKAECARCAQACCTPARTSCPRARRPAGRRHARRARSVAERARARGVAHLGAARTSVPNGARGHVIKWPSTIHIDAAARIPASCVRIGRPVLVAAAANRVPIVRFVVFCAPE